MIPCPSNILRHKKQPTGKDSSVWQEQEKNKRDMTQYGASTYANNNALSIYPTNYINLLLKKKITTYENNIINMQRCNKKKENHINIAKEVTWDKVY